MTTPHLPTPEEKYHRAAYLFNQLEQKRTDNQEQLEEAIRLYHDAAQAGYWPAKVALVQIFKESEQQRIFHKGEAVRLGQEQQKVFKTSPHFENLYDQNQFQLKGDGRNPEGYKMQGAINNAAHREKKYEARFNACKPYINDSIAMQYCAEILQYKDWLNQNGYHHDVQVAAQAARDIYQKYDKAGERVNDGKLEMALRYQLATGAMEPLHLKNLAERYLSSFPPALHSMPLAIKLSKEELGRVFPNDMPLVEKIYERKLYYIANMLINHPRDVEVNKLHNDLSASDKARVIELQQILQANATPEEKKAVQNQPEIIRDAVIKQMEPLAIDSSAQKIMIAWPVKALSYHEPMREFSNKLVVSGGTADISFSVSSNGSIQAEAKVFDGFSKPPKLLTCDASVVQLCNVLETHCQQISRGDLLKEDIQRHATVAKQLFTVLFKAAQAGNDVAIKKLNDQADLYQKMGLHKGNLKEDLDHIQKGRDAAYKLAADLKAVGDNPLKRDKLPIFLKSLENISDEGYRIYQNILSEDPKLRKIVSNMKPTLLAGYGINTDTLPKETKEGLNERADKLAALLKNERRVDLIQLHEDKSKQGKEPTKSWEKVVGYQKALDKEILGVNKKEKAIKEHEHTPLKKSL